MTSERTSLIRDDEEKFELCGIEETAVRHGFVRKVYSILGVQLVVTTLIGGIVMKLAETIAKSNPTLMLTLLVGSITTSIAMSCVFFCCPDTMRRSPTNYILLAAFTVAEAVMVGFISAQYTQESVLIVIAVTSIVVVGLTLFACQTKYDITGFLPYAYVALWAMFGFSLVLFIASMCGLSHNSPAFQTARLVYAFFGVLIFSFFIVLDTQLIVGGKHSKFRFGVDDYCMAAINLYLDIIQLFIYLLELFGDRK